MWKDHEDWRQLQVKSPGGWFTYILGQISHSNFVFLIFDIRYITGSSHCGSAEMNLTNVHEDVGLIPGTIQWVKDSALLWLQCTPAAAAPNSTPSLGTSYVVGTALKSKKTPKKPKKLSFLGAFFFFFCSQQRGARTANLCCSVYIYTWKERLAQGNEKQKKKCYEHKF